jgi:hypothetical protein
MATVTAPRKPKHPPRPAEPLLPEPVLMGPATLEERPAPPARGVCPRCGAALKSFVGLCEDCSVRE